MAMVVLGAAKARAEPYLLVQYDRGVSYGESVGSRGAGQLTSLEMGGYLGTDYDFGLGLSKVRAALALATGDIEFRDKGSSALVTVGVTTAVTVRMAVEPQLAEELRGMVRVGLGIAETTFDTDESAIEWDQPTTWAGRAAEIAAGVVWDVTPETALQGGGSVTHLITGAGNSGATSMPLQGVEDRERRYERAKPLNMNLVALYLGVSYRP